MNIGLIGAKFKVWPCGVVVHQVMLLSDGPEILALSAKCGLLAGAAADPQALLSEVHGHAEGLDDGPAAEHWSVSWKQEKLDGPELAIHEHGS